MKRLTTLAARTAALAVGALLAIVATTLVSPALLPGGGVGDPIYVDDLTLSLDASGQVAVEGEYIARHQTFWVRAEDIYDADTIGDPTVMMDTIVSATWEWRHCPFGGSWSEWAPVDPGGTLEDKGNNHYRSVLEQTLGTDGYYEFKLTVHDGDHPADDDAVSKTKQVCILGVDYVVVTPATVEFPTGGSWMFHGFCYNMGGDGERYYDESNQPIEGHADNDTRVMAILQWGCGPAELGCHVATEWHPISTCLNTHLANGKTGWGWVWAWYHGDQADLSDDVWDYAFFKLVADDDYFIDIADTDGSPSWLRNVPINGKDDVTEAVGVIQARLLLGGPPNGSYHVTLSESSSKISLSDTTFSGTFSGGGSAEHTFNVTATSSTPSAALGDTDITAVLRETAGGDQKAETIESITVYVFEFVPLDEAFLCNIQGGTSDYGVEEVDEDMFRTKVRIPWTGPGPYPVGAGDEAFAYMGKRFALKVRTFPREAFAGTVRARAEVNPEAEVHAWLWKAPAENGTVCGITVEHKFLKVTVWGGGGDEVAAIACDMTVKFDDAAQEQRGDWTRNTTMYNAGSLFHESWYEHWTEQIGQTQWDEPRDYIVGGDGHTLELKCGVIAGTTRLLTFTTIPARGAAVDAAYIDMEPLDDIDIYARGGLYEIQ